MPTKTQKTSTNGNPATSELPAEAIVIERIAAETLRIPIVGTTPLICHNFGAKARRQMLDAMQNRKTPKQPKNPEAEYEAACYRFEDGRYGHPAIAFKLATVGAARLYGKAVKMTELRQVLFVHGELAADGNILVPIIGEPQMREDVVRVGGMKADLRYRPEFLEWRANLHVTYVTSLLTRGSLVSLVDAGGMSVGIGEWRPEKDGVNGTYRVDLEHEIEVIS